MQRTAFHAALILAEVAMLAATAWQLAVAPTWWLLAGIPVLALVILVQVFTVGGFTLDKNGQPLTGRDADRYAKYRARMCPHERATLDRVLAGHSD